MSHSLRTPHLESGSSSAVLPLGDVPQGSNPALPGSLGGGGVLSRRDIGEPSSKIRGQKGSKRGQKGVKKGSKKSNPFFWTKILMDQTFGPIRGSEAPRGRFLRAVDGLPMARKNDFGACTRDENRT